MAYYIKGLPFKYKGTTNVEDCSTAKEVIEAPIIEVEPGEA